MTETILQNTTVSANGGTASGRCRVDAEAGRVFVILDGDSNSTDCTLEVTNANPNPAELNTDYTVVNPPSEQNIDATVDGSNTELARIGGIGGYGGEDSIRGFVDLTIQITNNAGGDTTVTLTNVDPQR